MNIIQKEIVRNSFMNAFNSYDKNAIAQKIITKNLIDILTNYSFPYQDVLEIGSGSGFLTKDFLAKYTPGNLVLNDMHISTIDLSKYKNDFSLKFIQGDAEIIEWGSSFNLIMSSSTLQWFHNLEAFFMKCYSHLKSNGFIAFSSFLPGNLKEIRYITGIGIDYVSKKQLVEMLYPYFEIIEIKSESITLYFDTPISILQHLKKTGVNCISKNYWTKRDMKKFSEEYENNYRTEKGLTLTYTPIYIIARKL